MRGTPLPPPSSLTGEANGLSGSDRLGFTGKATFAVLGSDGAELVERRQRQAGGLPMILER